MSKYVKTENGYDIKVGHSGTGYEAEIFNSLENIASGNNSHAEGFMTTASGDGSHAEGVHSIASGDYSHAEGRQTIASGTYSHAEGYSSKASGRYSHAEGDSIASGIYAHAEGDLSKASGDYSHAEGDSTTASGAYSHSEGNDTIAAGQAQHVQGQHNIEDVNSIYLHIVGNGESYKKRSNAHTLDWDGNAWFAGDVYVGGTSQNSDNTEKLATENYVNDVLGTLIGDETVSEQIGAIIQNQFATDEDIDAICGQTMEESIQTYVEETILGGEW